MKELEWIENWYSSHCNGDWEHQHGIKISTLDNPGWSLEIDLGETPLEDLEFDWGLNEKSENDWLAISAKNNKFRAAGDPKKLGIMLSKFREIAENK